MERLQAALVALDGLSVGDAFGERFFGSGAVMLGTRALPNPPWRWTDDTAMALSVVEVLQQHGRVDKDQLAMAFARRWAEEPWRGYGSSAYRILEAIHHGSPWWTVSRNAFGREGSKGNGGAMRVAPLGVWFADDLDAVISEARASAEVTHAHAEGMAGAVAVAVAAAGAHRGLRAKELLDFVCEHTPEGDTRDGLLKATGLAPSTAVENAVRELGNGSNVTAPDTVPFALWAAAHHIDDFAEAMWQTVSGLGDRDTTCAIAGGVVAAANTRIPQEWLSAREPLRFSLP